MESIWTNTRKRRSETGRWKNRRTNIPMFFMICWPTYPVGSACLARKIVYVRSIFRLVFFLLPLSMAADENIHRVGIFKQILFIRWTSTISCLIYLIFNNETFIQFALRRKMFLFRKRKTYRYSVITSKRLHLINFLSQKCFNFNNLYATLWYFITRINWENCGKISRLAMFRPVTLYYPEFIPRSRQPLATWI